MYNRYLKYFPSLTIPELTIVILTNENLFFFHFFFSPTKESTKFSFSPICAYVYFSDFRLYDCFYLSLSEILRVTIISMPTSLQFDSSLSLQLSIQFHPISHTKSVPSSPARPLTRNLEFLNKLISSLFSYIKYIRRFTPCSPVLVRNAEGTSSRRWNI